MIRHLPPPIPESAASGHIAGVEVESRHGDILTASYSPPVANRPHAAPDLPPHIVIKVEGSDEFGDPANADIFLDAPEVAALIAWLSAALEHMGKA